MLPNQSCIRAGRMTFAPWALKKRLLEGCNAEMDKDGKIGRWLIKAEVVAGLHRYHQTDVLIVGGNHWLNAFLLSALAAKGVRTLLVQLEADPSDQWNYNLIRHPVFRTLVDRVAGVSLAPRGHRDWAEYYFNVMASRIQAAEDNAMVLQPGKTINASILNPNGQLHFFVEDGQPMEYQITDPESLAYRQSAEGAISFATQLSVPKKMGNLHTVIFADTLIQTSQVLGISEAQKSDLDMELPKAKLIRLGSARCRLNNVADALKQPFDDFLSAADIVSRMSRKGLPNASA